jgi:Holliday junction resolvase-like predicted endonuclease
LNLFQEADRRFQETERLLKEQTQETERLLREQSQATDRKFQATDRKLNQLEQLFTSQWGKLMESLVEGDLVALLTARGIPITDTTTRLKGKRADGGNFEFDIIAHNGEELVVVEVKTTLKPQDVEDFIARLRQLKHWLPRYAHRRIYGAVAWLTADAGAERRVENRGLFSIRATGHSASIQNPPTFTPRAW